MMRYWFWVLVLAACRMAFGEPIGNLSDYRPKSSLQYALELDNASEVLWRVNQDRIHRGSLPVTWSTTAHRAAKLLAEYNLAHHTLWHEHPGFPSLQARLQVAGHSYQETALLSSYRNELVMRLVNVPAEKAPSAGVRIVEAYTGSALHGNALLDAQAAKLGAATLYDGYEVQHVLILTI